MTRYYFDLLDDLHTPDEEGIELNSLTRAEALAVRVLAESLLENPAPLPKAISVQVRNARGMLMRIVLDCKIDAS